MRIFVFIILFFALIVGGIWFGYQYFNRGTEMTRVQLERFIAFSIPADAQNLNYFTQQGVNQTAYIYFQLPAQDFAGFLTLLPCQKTLDDVSYTSFMADFQKKGVIGETNPQDYHQAFECTANAKEYQLAVYPHGDNKNIYFKIFTL